MRRALTLMLASVLAAGTLSLATSAPASAAASVSIKAIRPAVAPYLGTSTIKPSYTKKSGVKIVSARLTVKQGRTTVASSKPSAKLKAGTYAVTTTVTFKTSKRAKTKTTKRTQKVTVRQGAKNCATPADVKGVLTADELTETSTGDPDTEPVVRKKLYNAGRAAVNGTLADMAADYADDPDWGPYYAELSELFGPTTPFQLRLYPRCGGGEAWQADFVQFEAQWFVLNLL